MVTKQRFIDYFNDLLKNKAIYLWGANGETITPELCEKLYKYYGSSTYNKAYYDNKLKEGAGKIGADCSGSYCPMSGFDDTAKGYYNRCTVKGLVKDMPKDIPLLLFNAAFTHTGAYLGNGKTIEMRSSAMNVYGENLDTSRWTYYGIPSWIDYGSVVETPKQDDVDFALLGNVSDHLIRLNLEVPSFNKVDSMRGLLFTSFDANAKYLITRGIQLTLNKQLNAGLNTDGIMGPKTKAACKVYSMTNPGLRKEEVVYLIQAALLLKGYSMDGSVENNDLDGQYGKNTYEAVKEFQEDNRGLRIDGVAGPATIATLLN